MATRLVVLKDGIIQQIGTPKEVYDHPDNVFVGGFIGSPAMNFFKGTLNGNSFHIDESSIQVPEGKGKELQQIGYNNSDLIMGIRPEDIHYEQGFIQTLQAAKITCKIDVAELMGAEINLYTNLNGQSFTARVDSKSNIKSGDQVELAFDINNIHFFDPSNERRIR